MRALLEAEGFVRLGEDPGRVGRVRRRRPLLRLAGNAPLALIDAAAFTAFAEPGTVKAAEAGR